MPFRIVSVEGVMRLPQVEGSGRWCVMLPSSSYTGKYGETYQKSWLLPGLLKLGEAVFVLSKVQAGVGPKHGEHGDHGEQLSCFLRLRLRIFHLFNKLPMGLMRSKKWLRFPFLEHNDTDPCENHFKHWTFQCDFACPMWFQTFPNGVFVATVAAEQFRYRCLHLGGSSHSQVDIRGWLIYIPSRLISCNLGV